MYRNPSACPLNKKSRAWRPFEQAHWSFRGDKHFQFTRNHGHLDLGDIVLKPGVYLTIGVYPQGIIRLDMERLEGGEAHLLELLLLALHEERKHVEHHRTGH